MLSIIQAWVAQEKSRAAARHVVVHLAMLALTVALFYLRGSVSPLRDCAGRPGETIRPLTSPCRFLEHRPGVRALLCCSGFSTLSRNWAISAQGSYHLSLAARLRGPSLPGRAYEILPVAALIGTAVRARAIGHTLDTTVMRVSGVSDHEHGIGNCSDRPGVVA